MSIIVALFILYTGIKMVKETASPLIGGAPDKDMIENIIHDIKMNPICLDVHDVMVHNYGPTKFFISLHVEVDGYGDISFSEKALKAFEKYKIKGIKDVKKYNKMETTRYKPITSITGDYYASTIDFETLILYNCKDLGTTKIRESLGYTTNCTKCIAGKVKNLWDLDPKTKIYYTGLKDIDNDIFSIYSDPSIIFVSERFREMCIKENLTNILDKLVEVFDEFEYE